MIKRILGYLFYMSIVVMIVIYGKGNIQMKPQWCIEGIAMASIGYIALIALRKKYEDIEGSGTEELWKGEKNDSQGRKSNTGK